MFGSDGLRSARWDAEGAVAGGGSFTYAERRRIYRQMILNELRRGGLSSIRQVRLVQYAAKLGVARGEAVQMISAAREEYEAGLAARCRRAPAGAHERASAACSVRLRVGVVLLLAVAAQVALAVYLGWF